MSSNAAVLRPPCAPKIAEKGLRLTDTFHDRLVFVGGGPHARATGNGEEASVVVGYCARYFECGRFGHHGPWVEPQNLEFENIAGGNVRFTLCGLATAREYIAQVACVTPSGRGPWSPQSDRARTCCCAPCVTPPQLLFQTHTALLLGWSRKPQESPALVVAHEEDVRDFAVSVSPPGAPGVEVREVSVEIDKAAHAAAIWRDLAMALQRARQEQAQEDLVRTVSSSSIPDKVWLPDPEATFEFATVVRDLVPGSSYVAKACARTSHGSGQASQASAEVQTLAAAPPVGKLYVDDVQHDQLQISWERQQMPGLQPHPAWAQLGLLNPLEELEIRGYSVRWAAWSSWSRLRWQASSYVEVEALLSLDTGRVCFTVTDLEPEHRYVVEVCAHTSCGTGEWRRHEEPSICTAIVAKPPPVPDLVYATSNTLTFSFAAVEDARVVAYEVRWFAGWGRASKPVRFNAQSLAVGITGDKRWVVNMNHLRSNTKYVLQLRGVTKTEGFTKWSAKSEAMCTLMGSPEEEPELGVGVNDETPTLRGRRMAQQQLRTTTVSSTSAEVVEDLSQKLQTVLNFTIYHATAGVRLPSVNIPPVSERAAELLELHKGSRDAAVAEAARTPDDGWRSKLPEFLIQQVPVVGCSVPLLREVWRSLRQCILIAHLYGHDTASPETQALILTCLIPSGSSSTPAASSQSSMVGGAAVLVSRALAKETCIRATGLRSAGQVVELLEIAGGLLKGNGNGTAEEAASVSTAGSSAGADAQPMTATASSTSTDDDKPSSPARVAEVLFRPQNIEERPVVICGLLALWLLPILVSITRFAATVLAKRIQMELPVVSVVTLLLTTQVAGSVAVLQVQQNLSSFLSVPATLVFTLHAMLPGISVFLAMRSLLQGFSDAPYFAFLGAFNLASGFLRWADDVTDEATMLQRPVPRAAQWRSRVDRGRSTLWVVLLVDFVAEELLGRVCGLHSLRLLGLPIADRHATLVEYRTFSFAMGLVAAWSQARVLELLKRRGVLLRLLGAQKALFAGLTLLFMGAFAVVQQTRTVQFLHEVSPTPWWCCAVLWLRRFGAIAGALLPPLFFLLLRPQCLGALPVDILVPLAIGTGGVLGYLLCLSFMAIWQERRESLEADTRVLHLFPHMSTQARNKAAVVLRSGIRKGAEATKNTAIRWVAWRVVGKGAEYLGNLLGQGGGSAAA